MSAAMAIQERGHPARAQYDKQQFQGKGTDDVLLITEGARA
jgi:hypothetical protein